VPAGTELKPCQRIDRHGIRFDAGDVAHDDAATLREQRADAIAEAGKVRTRDRAANRERDLESPGLKGHRR
jgi:hypothetical protein